MTFTTIEKKYGDIDWSIGCFTKVTPIILEILDALKYYNYTIPTFKYAFGSPPCRFNGGRIICDEELTVEKVVEFIQRFASHGIGVRYTFQNIYIEEKDLLDEKSNNFLKILEENNITGNNGVIVYSDLLAEYIKQHYPSLKLISSLVKPAIEVGLVNDTPQYYNNLLKKYDIVVVNASHVFEENFLESIDDVSRIEVIANSNCSKNCKLAATHYSAIANALKIASEKGKGDEFQKARDVEWAISDACIKIKQAEGMRNLLTMSEEQIKYLANKGIKHFKIEGREYCNAAIISDISRYICEGHILYRFIDRKLA